MRRMKMRERNQNKNKDENKAEKGDGESLDWTKQASSPCLPIFSFFASSSSSKDLPSPPPHHHQLQLGHDVLILDDSYFKIVATVSERLPTAHTLPRVLRSGVASWEDNKEKEETQKEESQGSNTVREKQERGNAIPSLLAFPFCLLEISTLLSTGVKEEQQEEPLIHSTIQL